LKREVGRETAARGARWIAIATVLVGVSNYGYALLLTHLLPVADYARFAAGQSLILWAMNVAVVSVPWVLAQSLARATTDEERAVATRFAKIATAGSGLAAGLIVSGIATQFAGPATVGVLAVSTFLLFLGTTTTGWLQGHERMGSLAGIYIAENVLKNAAGVLLVMTAGLGANGALAAFGIGALAMLVKWPRTPRERGATTAAGSWRSVLAARDLWRQAMFIGGAQGIVSLFVAVDVVMVAVLPESRALAASYQASATLSRVPLYLAGAIATAFFPALSRAVKRGAADVGVGGVGDEAGRIAGQAIDMYAAIGLPIAIVLATARERMLSLVFPSSFSSVDELLRYTAITGLAAGGISLITAFFQAADDYACVRWLAVGLVGYVSGLTAGWWIDGIIGLAAGGAAGAALAVALMAGRLVHKHGWGVISGSPVLTSAATMAILIALRHDPYPWLAVATLSGVYAGLSFMRPRRPRHRARHARQPRSGADVAGLPVQQDAHRKTQQPRQTATQPQLHRTRQLRETRPQQLPWQARQSWQACQLRETRPQRQLLEPRQTHQRQRWTDTSLEGY
jgi:O-antigen/teichoic acid export membrane protein